MLGRSFRISPIEIGLIILVVVLLFGVSKLPKLGKSLGEGIQNFRKASTAQDETAEAEEKAAEDSKTVEAKDSKTVEAKAEKQEDATKAEKVTESEDSEDSA